MKKPWPYDPKILGFLERALIITKSPGSLDQIPKLYITIESQRFLGFRLWNLGRSCEHPALHEPSVEFGVSGAV